jgi:hypothetical protein
MQNIKVIFFMCLFLFLSEKGHGVDWNKEIQKADKLFAARKYTESLKVYERVFAQKIQLPPQAFLKMAFVQEGLGDYTNSLYYLNLYYVASPQTDILLHIEKIANEYRLQGYEYSDLDFLRVFYERYFTEIALLCMFIGLLGVGWVVYLRVYKQTVSTPYKTALMTMLLSMFLAFTYLNEETYGIIEDDNTYLMSSPSAGSDLQTIVEKGHKVKILGKKDIWYRVAWKGKEAYIIEKKLLPIRF